MTMTLVVEDNNLSSWLKNNLKKIQAKIASLVYLFIYLFRIQRAVKGILI